MIRAGAPEDAGQEFGRRKFGRILTTAESWSIGTERFIGVRWTGESAVGLRFGPTVGCPDVRRAVNASLLIHLVTLAEMP